MQKIPTLFVRDWDGDRRYVLPEITPGCEWVIDGEGTPTRKYDGTCVLYAGGVWWARREVKRDKPLPENFQPIERDAETGKVVGWEPAEVSPFWRYLTEAIDRPDRYMLLTDGTYELCGPKVNGNPERFTGHMLVRHEDAEPLPDAPRDYNGLAAWLHAHPYEGIVWHHPDGRMAKIKRRDFRAPQPAMG
jgi:hypothetical protein